MKWLLSLLLACSLQAQGWLDTGNARTVYVKHKTAHALVGLTLVYLSHEAGDYRPGLVAALILAFIKEHEDRAAGGQFRVGDIAWTVAPAYTVAIAFRW